MLENSMYEIKLLLNERIYETIYDLLIQKISDDTSRKHYISLKNDCILFIEESGTFLDEKEKIIIFSYDIYKSRKIYKIHKSVHGIYIYPSSDYRFYFLDKDSPIKSREMGLKHITHIILLRYYSWEINVNNKKIDILSQLFSNTNLQDYIIKPNTALSIDNNHNDIFIENVEVNLIKEQFKTSLF